MKANSLEYDLLNVPSDSWSVWVGSIQHAEVSIFDNACHDDVDCNLNGQCVAGKCECYSTDVSQDFFWCWAFLHACSMLFDQEFCEVPWVSL
jgi:hypothetical protein